MRNKIKKTILAITGIRSEYDILYPVLKAIEEHPNFKLELVVSGAHLSSWHNNSINTILADGFKVTHKIKNLLKSNSDGARAGGTGILTSKLSKIVEKVKPDFILALGDREEPLAAAVVANYMKIPMVHIAGGDSAYGNADDHVRHAISKLAHLHFTFTDIHKKRLLKMGEEPKRVFCVGNPALDRIKSTPVIGRKKLSDLLDIDITNEPFVVILQHPFSLEIDHAYIQMKTTLQAVKKSGLKAVVIYPNTDPGGREMIKAIEEYAHDSQFKIFKNLERLAFVNILREAVCLVGNSSCGFLEAPFLKLPVINIGERQKGRINTGNVIFLDHDVSLITKMLLKIAKNATFRKRIISQTKNIYGAGRAGVAVANTLAKQKINRNLLLKKLTH